MSAESAIPAEESLDRLSQQALDGDAGAAATFFASLRVRFLSIAKRRVREDSLEDVVQEALQIVHAKYGERESDRGILVWSLTVLRNVIGNYYQAKERSTRREAVVEDLEILPAAAGSGSTLGWPVEIVDGPSEVTERILQAITSLAEQNPRCGSIFQRILESLDLGGGPREVSQRALAAVQRDDPDLSRGSFYTALHRCRARLREILAAMEASPGHD